MSLKCLNSIGSNFSKNRRIYLQKISSGPNSFKKSFLELRKLNKFKYRNVLAQFFEKNIYQDLSKEESKNLIFSKNIKKCFFNFVKTQRKTISKFLYTSAHEFHTQQSLLNFDECSKYILTNEIKELNLQINSSLTSLTSINSYDYRIQKLFKELHCRLQNDKSIFFQQKRFYTSDFDDVAFKQIDTSFNNAQEAFKSKTNLELLRGYIVFKLCSINFIVDHNKKFMKLSQKLLGKTLFEKLMKATFYGQFVAGENSAAVHPVVQKNMSFGVKSILDYSAEKDISTEEAKETEKEALGQASIRYINDNDENSAMLSKPLAYGIGDRRDNVFGARTYFYEDEQQCDENMQHFIEGIEAVSGVTNATGFAAIKLTALGRPQFLLQLSEVLRRVRHFYDILAKGYGTGKLTKTDFERHLRSFNLDDSETQKWFTILDVTKDGEIDLLDWQNLLEVNVSLAKVLRVPNIQTGTLEPIASFTDMEEEQMKNMIKRINYILKYAKERDVRVMIDAEQTYFQDAINRLSMEMMRKFNKDQAIVFNTYQCYLKKTYRTVSNDMALSKRENFFFGAKLVRGAYMDQERARALSMGYEDPIQPSYEATSKNFETIVDYVMQSINQRPKGEIAVMMATHNEDTVRMIINKMKDYRIKSTDRLICFGQLYGMCDQISFPLGQAGYSVYKYVPYGPVEEVIPYLSRRAVENKGILAKAKKEKCLIRSELLRRIISFQWFYKPPRPDILKQSSIRSKNVGETSVN